MGLNIDVYVNGSEDRKRLAFILPPRVGDKLSINDEIFTVDELRHNLSGNRFEVYASGKQKAKLRKTRRQKRSAKKKDDTDQQVADEKASAADQSDSNKPQAESTASSPWRGRRRQ